MDKWKYAHAVNASKVTRLWKRTCQECGYVSHYKSPRDYKSEVWRDTKCKRCHSMGLDYGSEDNRGKEPEETEE